MRNLAPFSGEWGGGEEDTENCFLYHVYLVCHYSKKNYIHFYMLNAFEITRSP